MKSHALPLAPSRARPARDSNRGDGIHLDAPSFFATWYESMVKDAPVLAALTINSSICGDAMHFLQMFKKGDPIISHKQFDVGVRYRNELKNYSARVLQKSAMQFYCPSS